MTNTGFNLFDPMEGLKIPAQLEEKLDITIDLIFPPLWVLHLEN